MHTPNENRISVSHHQAENEKFVEGLHRVKNRFHDDRMYVLEVAETTQFKFPYDFDQGETHWSVITRGNSPCYPITRTDEFNSYEEAVTYLKSVAPLTPRGSLDGECPEPAPSWNEFQDWLVEEGLPPMPY
jgi:hypothetical protein